MSGCGLHEDLRAAAGQQPGPSLRQAAAEPGGTVPYEWASLLSQGGFLPVSGVFRTVGATFCPGAAFDLILPCRQSKRVAQNSGLCFPVLFPREVRAGSRLSLRHCRALQAWHRRMCRVAPCRVP